MELKQMELKQFVKETLLSIVSGVDEANTVNNRFRIIGVKRNIGGYDGNNVEFDVSIAVSEKSSDKIGGKAGVTLLNVVSVSAGIDSKLAESNCFQNTNRLKFTVWVSENELKQ